MAEGAAVVQSHYELAVVFLLATGLKFIWDWSRSGRLAQSTGLRGELQARIEILARYQFRMEANQMREAKRSFVVKIYNVKCRKA